MSRRPVLAIAAVAAIATVSVAASHTAAQAPSGPSLQITQGTLSQVGDDLHLALRFSRAVPAKQLQAASGRVICAALNPSAATRRSVCVSYSRGRLRATIGAIDASGGRSGRSRSLRGARIGAQADALTLQAPASALRVTLGLRVTWQAFVRFNDGGQCAQALATDPAACTQRFPAAAASLRTRSRRLPAFARRGRLRLLATGDSQIQIVDSFLKQRLERRRKTRVRSDAYIGTGISKPAQLNWRKKARRQAGGYKPDVTVMIIGANDGFVMKTPSGASVPCCGAAWVTEYARRVQSMMRSYLRGGRSRVYWLTLPAPRSAAFARVFNAVNEAVVKAGKRFPSGVRVIDMAKVFTPGGVYRRTMAFRGRRVTVRQGDGIHLSNSGASIAATLLIERLRGDRLLPRLR